MAPTHTHGNILSLEVADVRVKARFSVHQANVRGHKGLGGGNVSGTAETEDISGCRSHDHEGSELEDQQGFGLTTFWISELSNSSLEVRLGIIN